MGKDPAPTRTSTDFVDPPSRYLMIDSATEGVEWENVTTDKMFQMVCEAMKKIDENAESKTPISIDGNDATGVASLPFVDWLAIDMLFSQLANSLRYNRITLDCLIVVANHRF